MEFVMCRIALMIAFLAILIAPAVAQKAKIEAVNAKWVELCGKGDFEGIAQLYTVDAITCPPGSAMVKGRAAIGAMWKGLAEHVSNPKVTTLDVKRLDDQGSDAEGNFREISCRVGKGPGRMETRRRYL
jgi:ketosteroid isomerase-like protein